MNTNVKFSETEVIELGAGVRAVAPNQTCQRLYFSADGENDVDIFSVDRIDQ